MTAASHGRTANGRFAGGNKVAAKKAASAPGVTGIVAYGGYITNPGEKNQKLVGLNKWITYANLYNVAIIATAARYSNNLIAGTDWHLEANPAGGRGAKKGLDVVQKGLIDAPLRVPWRQLAAKQSMFRFGGSELHATAMRRRSDGLIVYSQIEHRPLHTIERWNRTDETQPFDSVDQRSPETGKMYNIPLDECWYTVDDALGDDPTGVGLFRHLTELADRLGLYTGLERGAFQSDLNGVPLASVPFEEIMASLDPGLSEVEKIAARDAAWATVRAFMENRQRSPDMYQWLALDSAIYRGVNNPDVVTAIKKWALDIVKTDTANLDKVDRVINRLEIEAARLLGIEFAMIGGEGGGTYNAHADKTTMLGAQLEACGDRLGWTATHQLARRLVIANGLDPDTCTPTITMEPISTTDLEIVTRSLANIALAGLPANDPARNVLRKRMRLPPEPEVPYDLIKPPKLVPAPGDGKPPPGEIEIEPTAATDPATPNGKPEPAAGTQGAPGDKAPAKKRKAKAAA